MCSSTVFAVTGTPFSASAPFLCVPFQSKAWTGGHSAEESSGGGDSHSWSPGPGDEAKAHSGCGRANRAAGAIQTGKQKSLLLQTIHQTTRLHFIDHLSPLHARRLKQTWIRPNRHWRKKTLIWLMKSGAWTRPNKMWSTKRRSWKCSCRSYSPNTQMGSVFGQNSMKKFISYR